MSVKQISVFLENKAGTMLSMTSTLAAHNIDMRALSLAETNDFGIVRVIVDDVFEASTVLKDAGFIFNVTSVVCVCIPDEPGGLNSVLQVLSDEGISIEYMYAFLGGAQAKHAYMIFRVQDHKAAQAALRSRGLQIVDQDHIARL
ncbi:MAG: acetolactate synthase [Oscillospiraceae bacterium]|nr:acetolactate synthase [Oscillospiraceae bacterium]